MDNVCETRAVRAFKWWERQNNGQKLSIRFGMFDVCTGTNSVLVLVMFCPVSSSSKFYHIVWVATDYLIHVCMHSGVATVYMITLNVVQFTAESMHSNHFFNGYKTLLAFAQNFTQHFVSFFLWNKSFFENHDGSNSRHIRLQPDQNPNGTFILKIVCVVLSFSFFYVYSKYENIYLHCVVSEWEAMLGSPINRFEYQTHEEFNHSELHIKWIK